MDRDHARQSRCTAADDMDRKRRLNLPHIAVIPPSTNSSAPVT
jgi:hypothetical protein